MGKTGGGGHTNKREAWANSMRSRSPEIAMVWESRASDVEAWEMLWRMAIARKARSVTWDVFKSDVIARPLRAAEAAGKISFHLSWALSHSLEP